MAQRPPIVKDGLLTYPQGGSSTQVEVNSSDWYTWLETASSFAFRSEHSSFTARKERAGNRRGSLYWRAYCTREGKLHRVYLGKSEELTLERLVAVAAALAGQGNDGDALDADTAAVPSSRAFLPGTTLPSEQAAELPPPFPRGDFSRTRAALPTYLTSLLGREQEVQAVSALLARPEVRLLTLTGTPGVGKTRLGLQVASELSDTFADGVCFVSLASLSDPDLVLPTLTQALSLPEARGRSPLEHLQACLHDTHLLLLLDNFEQVASAAVLLVALLQTCPDLKALVTSRAVLHVRGEYEVQVSPLDLPDPKQCADVELLTRNAAVTLFTQRAQAIAPDFALTRTNAPVIAAICTQLDGVPLAIELAAARIKLLSPQQLLSRLAHRFDVLTSGAQDLPLRQQTLRATLQWSFELLSPGEQRLFWRLAVFVGGCELSAVEAVCRALGDGATAVLDGVQRLLDNNLLFERKQATGEPRLLMLETIREYGQACSASSGEAEATRQAHAEYYLALAEEAEPKLLSAEQLQWLDRLEQEHDNLRAALSWLLEKEQIELALRLGRALWAFWVEHNHLREGQRWFEKALNASNGVVASVRARAIYAASSLAYYGGDLSRATVYAGECLKLYRELGDKRDIAIALNALGHIARTRGDYAAIRALCEESLPLLQELGDTHRIAEALYLSAYGVHAQGDDTRACAVAKESLALCREVGERTKVADILHALGLFAYTQGDYAAARTFYEESLTISREVGRGFMPGGIGGSSRSGGGTRQGSMPVGSGRDPTH